MAKLEVVSDTTNMPLYSTMCKAILDCRRVDEVAKLQDDVKRQLYGQQIKDGNTMKQALNEIYLRAERQLGTLLAVLPKRPGTRYDLRPKAEAAEGSQSKQEVLERNNIPPRRASRAERIASIPKKEFEQEVKKPKASIRKLSDYAKTREPKVKPEKLKPKWHDPHLDARIKLIEGLQRISDGLKRAALGMRIKDAVLDVMMQQETNLPSSVNHELRKIKKQVEALHALWVPLCPCPFKNQKPATDVPTMITYEKDTTNAEL